MAEQLLSAVARHETLPASYVRPESQRPRLDEVLSDDNIPTIDLGSGDRARIVREIGDACRNYGFFQDLDTEMTLQDNIPVEQLENWGVQQPSIGSPPTATNFPITEANEANRCPLVEPPPTPFSAASVEHVVVLQLPQQPTMTNEIGDEKQTARSLMTAAFGVTGVIVYLKKLYIHPITKEVFQAQWAGILALVFAMLLSMLTVQLESFLKQPPLKVFRLLNITVISLMVVGIVIIVFSG